MCAKKCGITRDEEEELGLRSRWNAGWARHYAAGGPTPGKMAQAYQYGRAIVSGMGGVEEEMEYEITLAKYVCYKKCNGDSH